MRRIAGNGLTVVISVVVGYLAFQLVFFRALLTNVDLPVRPWLPETAGVLVQNTKAETVPHNYVAILGDSYAEGVGDWLIKVGEDERRGFHAAHVIHDLTGQDVVTFGKGGAGSAEAFVLLPSRALKGSECLIFPTIDDPDQILAYFFEGNDIEDNLRFAEKVRQKYGQAGAPEINAYLTSEYAVYPWWRCHLHLGDVLSRIVRFQYQYYTGTNFDFPRPEYYPNALRIADDVIRGGQMMSGPALELNNEQIGAGIQVFNRALIWLRTRFPHSRIAVVFVPSPLALYRLAEPEIEAEFLDEKLGYVRRRHPAELVARRSHQICELVREGSQREHVGFINPRRRLRETAATVAIHGPNDWGHFNEIGYRVLGEELVRGLSASTSDDCDNASLGKAAGSTAPG